MRRYTGPMLAAAHSAAVLGIDALDVTVEVHVANGLPQWTKVGTKPRSAVSSPRGRRCDQTQTGCEPRGSQYG